MVLFDPPWLYVFITGVTVVTCLLCIFLGVAYNRLVERSQIAEPPQGAAKLTPEDFENISCRTGFTTPEISRLYREFMLASQSNSTMKSVSLLKEVKYFQGPLQDRMVKALHLPELADFVVFVTAMSLFSERAPLDDKMKFLFDLYNVDDSGSVGRRDLRDLLDMVLPPTFLDDRGERSKLIERAVEGTFQELATSQDVDELSADQFRMAATSLIGERCTIFF